MPIRILISMREELAELQEKLAEMQGEGAS